MDWKGEYPEGIVNDYSRPETTECISFAGVNAISCHAWNLSRELIALSPNNQEVHIFKRSSPDFKLEEVLCEHDLRVTGIDWAPKTNRIVTCAVDRNAYVWTQTEDGKWKPTLVLLRINRAATCVKWSPEEDKFAVGSGARLISVCYFDEDNDWWVSKHIKKPIRSTITCIDWHPNNILLVAGSADFKIRVFSAFIIDKEKQPQPTAWGPRVEFGANLLELPNSSNGGGWVHGVAFSSDGNRICWVGHDSSINIVDASQQMKVMTLRTDFLPFCSCLWVSTNSVVAVGHGCCPMLFSINESGEIIFSAKLDVSTKKEAGGLSAMRKFQSLDRQARIEINDTTLETIHQNTITCIVEHSTRQKGSRVLRFSTSGLDGQVVIWDFQNLTNSMKDLKVVP